MRPALKPFCGLLLGALLVVGTSVPAAAYLKLGTTVGDRTVNLQWTTFPVRYFLTDQGAAGVTPQMFQEAVRRAFTTWEGVEGADIRSEFVGFTQAQPRLGDDMNVLGFVNRPDQERVLGATSFLVDITDGRIIESDIFFNSFFDWSAAPGGESGRFDLESIALHEIGHMLGLGHSAIGETEMISGGRRVIAAETVMFPIAFSRGNIQGRTLRADDIAGMVDIYGSNAVRRRTGSVSGRVTKNGAGVFGAHVVAFNPRTGRIIAGFSLNQNGDFTIAGLDPGPHVIRVEPLDDAEISSFLTPTNVDVDFRVKFYERLVVVPRGGGTRGVNVTVVPK
jgi:hypothetical protein